MTDQPAPERTPPETTTPETTPPETTTPEATTPETTSAGPRPPISLLQQRGIEAEVLIPMIRRLEEELGRERAHEIAREVIGEIAREQGRRVAEALGRDDIEGFTHVKDTWSGAGGDLQIETLRQDEDVLEFNVVGCRFAEMYRALGAQDLGFVLSCHRDFSLSEGYSDGLHLERTQTIMQGAAYCDFRYRRRPAPEQPAPGSTSEQPAPRHVDGGAVAPPSASEGPEHASTGRVAQPRNVREDAPAADARR